MPSAVILINVEIGKEERVAEALCRLTETDDAFIVFGIYDIVAKVTTGSMDSLESLITSKVRTIPGILTTITLMVNKECHSEARMQSPLKR